MKGSSTDGFSSRWGLILASLGMAIGTGNIWRFPRIVAQNGGGSFLITWIIFLFTWSIPLIVLEFTMGKSARKGTVGALGRLNGRNWLWMGVFVGSCAIFIFFYYSVVTGWCFRFALHSIGDLFSAEPPPLASSAQNGPQEAQEAFLAFTSGWSPVCYLLVAVGLGGLVVARGVAKGVELVSKILVPMLFVILLIAAIRSLTLPGASKGLEYLFHVDLAALTNHEIWIQGLTQSAWSTGAGWGLVLTYASYMRKREDVVLNSVLTGLGNNSASLLVAFAIFPAVFALAPADVDPVNDILMNSGPAATGISFIWIPVLFKSMPFGGVFSVLFFLALSVAALSSLIAMIQLGVRVLEDAGMTRIRATLIIVGAGFALGLPSALSADVLSNQDWVWSVGLLFSGLFMAVAVIRFGARRFREKFINSDGNDFSLGSWFELFTVFLIPIQGIVLILWWTIGSIRDDAGGEESWWNPIRNYGLSTCLLQLGLVVAVAWIFQGALERIFLRGEKSIRESLDEGERERVA